MLINLTELFSRDGKEKDYTQYLEMKKFQAPDGIYDFVDVEPVRIHILNTGNRILILNGSVNLTLMIPCSRCLELVRVPFSLTLECTLDMNQPSIRWMRAIRNLKQAFPGWGVRAGQRQADISATI